MRTAKTLIRLLGYFIFALSASRYERYESYLAYDPNDFLRRRKKKKKKKKKKKIKKNKWNLFLNYTCICTIYMWWTTTSHMLTLQNSS